MSAASSGKDAVICPMILCGVGAAGYRTRCCIECHTGCGVRKRQVLMHQEMCEYCGRTSEDMVVQREK